MNENRTITAEIQQSGNSMVGDFKSIATVQDLHQLKRVFSASIIKHGDINKQMCQNCDATTRVLKDTVISELQLHVLHQMLLNYISRLQYGHTVHIIMRNLVHLQAYKIIARSLWAGLMT